MGEWPLDPPLAQQLRRDLVDYLAMLGEVRTERVKDALNRVPRHLFLGPTEQLEAAYENRPLPIGYDQTISQPAVVALMTEALELSGSERVLEVGTGSGYQAAVLSVLAREVFSIELVPELAKSSAERLANLGYANVQVRQGDGYRGWPEEAPFDRIIVTAAAPSVPAAWFEQLAEGGILVAPVGVEWGQHLLRYRKRGGRTSKEDLGWVVFVPCRHREARTATTDAACVAFLQWALPRAGLEWRGFRKTRRLVGKRVLRRASQLGLEGFAAYRAHLEATPEEWPVFDTLCRIPISRFYRDRAVFDSLRRVVLPRLAENALARGDKTLRAWSIGCASGEEPYTLAMAWRLDVAWRFPTLDLVILATDSDEGILERARRGCYGGSSLKQLPPEWHSLAFDEAAGVHCIHEDLQQNVTFRCEDVRTTMPDGLFDLILCRNVAFTYFAPPQQRTIAEQLVRRLVKDGVLVVGSHETAPYVDGLLRLTAMPCAYVLWRFAGTNPGLSVVARCRSAPPPPSPRGRSTGARRH
jgi:chemotaxis protein methyltransferase CheR